ncbi:hypothetical protein [Clostridium transplantifaecale]|uniref:hypothetical protein n=1 Tax=Clostridium transplantifaecale TaxID=2479838 RepID=UPI000F638657|nr:hypothetical protein [Clostridium transplantifaecale]
MATVEAAIQQYAGMPATFNTITGDMRAVISSFKALQIVSSDGLNITAIQAGKAELVSTGTEVKRIGQSIDTASKQMETFDDKISQGKSEAVSLGSKFKDIMKNFDGKKAVKMGVDFVSDALSLQSVQQQAETKLGTVMQQRMGASPEDIQSIKNMASAQQQLGVIGDEVQLSGAQQLATYLGSADALGTLLPAMNNLAVSQNGVGVSSNDMINVGSKMGQAMQGQTSVLTEMGIGFSEAQAQMLQCGNEQERAATLAQIITDNIGNMNAVMAGTPQGQIQQMKNAWGEIKEMVGAQVFPAVQGFFDVLRSHLPQAQSLFMGLAGGISVIIAVISLLADGLGTVVEFFQSYWTVFEPIIWGIVAALGVYLLVTEGVKLAQMAGAAIMTAYKAAQTFLSIGFGVLTGSTTAAGAAVATFNSALLASPITWIIIGIIALVAILFAGVAAFNHFTGASVSAAGLIAAVFGMLGALIYNTFIVPLWNNIAAFINFFYNVWNEPIASIKLLFYDLALTVIGYVANMAHAIEDVINHIPGIEIDIAAGLDNFKSQIESAAKDVKSESEWKEIVEKKNFLDYGEVSNAAYDKGAQFNLPGMGLSDSSFDSAFDPGVQPPFGGDAGNHYNSDMSDISNNTGNTAASTAAMANTVDVMDEDLKYMRDAAEQEIINRFTLAELKLDINNNNTLTKKADFGDLAFYMETLTGSFLSSYAEGDHI